MEGAGWQVGVFVVIFFLVIILGLQIQISGLYRERDNDERRKKDDDLTL